MMIRLCHYSNNTTKHLLAVLWVLIFLLSTHTHAFVQDFEFPSVNLPDRRPSSPSLTSKKLLGQVRLVVTNSDSLFFNTKGLMTHSVESGYMLSNKIRVADYAYNDCNQLILTNESYYGLRNNFIPEETVKTLWTWSEDCLLLLKETQITIKGGKQTEEKNTEYAYNKKGELIKEKTTTMPGGLVSGWYFKFDTINRLRLKFEYPEILIQKDSFDQKAQLVYSEYYQEGRLSYYFTASWKPGGEKMLRCFSLGEDQTFYLYKTALYNLNNESVADTLHNIKVVQQYTGEAGGLYHKQVNTDSSGHIFWVIEYTLDALGNLLHRKETWPDRDSCSQMEDKYDPNGNLIYRFPVYDCQSMQVEYVFDGQYNWIKSRTTFSGQAPEWKRRQVYYYDD